jgi:plastocyanin
MKRILFCVAAVLTLACGNTTKPAEPQKKAAETPKPVEYFHVDPGTAGSITGVISFSGPKPSRKLISMEAEAGCQQANAGRPVYEETVVTGKKGGLANAFVYIQTGLEDKKFEPTEEAVILDQKGCMFVPRVAGIRAGQILDLKNGDSVAHNIHPLPKNNREWNQEQPPHAADVEHRFARPEIMIPVKCNIHAWMHSYIGVVGHPYFAVTASDGAFTWKNVPPGDYTIAVWHEKLGLQTQPVHVAASAGSAVNFTYR